jgi:hypothetical protein
LGHEQNRKEPPHKVKAAVFTEGWYLRQIHRDWPDMSLYVRLVTLQVEPLCRPRKAGCVIDRSQPGQGFQQARHLLQLSRRHENRLRSAAGQHLPDPLAELGLVLAVLCHLLPEVLGIEDQSVEQEPRRDVRPALPALVPPDPKGRFATARGASLECQGGIERGAAGLAPAPALGNHGQWIAASRAGMAPEHYVVVEQPGLTREAGYCLGKAEGLPDNVRLIGDAAHQARRLPRQDLSVQERQERPQPLQYLAPGMTSGSWA